jgi:hypothetical protein
MLLTGDHSLYYKEEGGHVVIMMDHGPVHVSQIET